MYSCFEGKSKGKEPISPLPKQGKDMTCGEKFGKSWTTYRIGFTCKRKGCHTTVRNRDQPVM
jgi:hypothetical protein